ncbi:non-structural maintenance of chromosomes element 4 homolog A-like [Ruditapes philippinarum]|uniref:non-structural maintenance of chromosomes element 4 homolog A-like n=1 Tax=Ruditapes philippinarum TaxID=129788 RepID=UPI00295C1E0C|nr:non-structural maintenance of chromosomes element 4 homolog A-like [Ruditapes philippinarum]
MADNEGFQEETQQNREERRQIRLRYRNLIDELQENREELINPESNELSERLREADELFKPVKCAREVALDSQAMSMIANIGRMKAQALHTEFVRFQPTEFASKLINFVGGQTASQSESARISALGWARLGKATQPFFKRAPTFQYMLGSFERGPKPVKERQQRAPKEKDNIVGKETVPQQLKDFKTTDQSEATTEEVERVLQILRDLYQEIGDGKDPLSYFDFVLNPDSFGRTVENIFHVSFLIRDGLAKMVIDNEGLPTIYPVDQAEAQKNKERGSQRRHQTVMSITPGDWKELVKIFKIEEAAIPPRESQENGAQNGHG